MTFRATVLTLYPEMFPGHLGYSLSGKAMERVIGRWKLSRSGISPETSIARWMIRPLVAALAWC